ncbi:MAG: FAD-binding protein [Deltaproteobacteria bacterium]|nr:FAD-binding protein [Deltaproteobacteria bacterium]
MLETEKVPWDKTAEVVIVGYGMAGTVAAITAHDKGAEVLVLEKQPANSHHTNSSMSGGFIIVPSDVEGAVKYMEALYRVDGDLYWTEREIIRVWAEYSSQNKDWIENHGGKLELIAPMGEHFDVPGADSIHGYSFPGRGLRMMRILDQRVKERRIEIMHDTAAERLITDRNGQVIGVRTNHRDGGVLKTLNVRASRAVILTCGGFEFNEQMKLNYLGVYPAHFTGSPANTGDGIRMGLDVGADLWHMNCCSAGAVARFPDCPTAFFVELGGQGWLARLFGRDLREPAGYVVVDRNGSRFINENIIGTKIHCAYYEFTSFDSRRLRYPRVPSYWIFDQNRMEAGQLALLAAGASGPQQLHKWSTDNSEELEKGWIITAETISELATKIDIQPEVLQKTITTYNLCCEQGEDPDFGRGALNLVPLSRPPFYAVKLWPGGANTQGGPKRNSQSQVLDPAGRPIPRLYSAGELGSIFGMIYPSGGGNLAECIVFGRIAGENAAKEELGDYIPRA